MLKDLLCSPLPVGGHGLKMAQLQEEAGRQSQLEHVAQESHRTHWTST